MYSSVALLPTTTKEKEMTRIQMINKVATIQVEQYCNNTDKLHHLLITGHLGLCELANHELEQLYEELTGKALKIS